MTTILTSKETSDHSTYLEFVCDKTTVHVSVMTCGLIRVIVQNASHRVFKGSGRVFRNFADAVTAYKSEAVRSIINAAQAEVAL
jgi:hypothetical protein